MAWRLCLKTQNAISVRNKLWRMSASKGSRLGFAGTYSGPNVNQQLKLGDGYTEGEGYLSFLSYLFYIFH